VRRVFAAFAAGQSPRAIARALNDDGLPGPGGRPWSDTTIRGHHARRTGLLHNKLDVGRLVWNRQRYVKDPATGRRLTRLNPESEWIIRYEPELRIVDRGPLGFRPAAARLDPSSPCAESWRTRGSEPGYQG
jgi:site-specific DNA recombinase